MSTEIDIERPVETGGRKKVIDLIKVGSRLEGFIVTSPGECIGPIEWSLDGYGMTVGYRDDRFMLRNVPDALIEATKPLIDIGKPVETIEGFEVDSLCNITPNRIHGYVHLPWGGSFRAAWDLYGNAVTADDGKISGEATDAYAIRNKLTPEQVEQERIADFRCVIQQYVERQGDRPFRDSDYGEIRFANGGEIGFVYRPLADPVWQVWDLCDGFGPITVFPGFIQGEKLGEFWGWLRQRKRDEYERGLTAGFKQGDAERVRLIAEAKLALERAEQGLSTDPRDYVDEDIF